MTMLDDQGSELAMVFGRAAGAMSVQFPERGKGPQPGASRPPSLCLRSAGYCILPSAFCLLFAAFCLLPSAAGQNRSGPASQIDPKAQELLDRAVPALGGPTFLGAKSLTTRGRIFAIADGATAGFAPFQSTVEYPEKRRFSYGKDKPVILVNNGERGWQLDRYGMIRQPPDQIRRWRMANRYSLENLLRRVIHEPGLLIQDGGVDFVDDLSVRVVDIVDAQQVQLRLHLDKAKFLPVRIAYRVRNQETGDWDEFADVYSDYRKFQEIQTPMHITRFLNGERFSEVFRNAAEYNASYPTNLFEPVR
jgi:hypothetical protein